MFKSKDEENTTIHIKTTERWRDFKKTMKYIFMGIFFILVLYGLFLAFGLYVYGSFLISLFISSIIFMNKIEVPSQNYVESRIEIEKDDNGNDKIGYYVFNEYKIPNNLLKEFKIKGDTKITYKSKNGKIRHICEKIDFNKKEIHYCWLSGLSDWEAQIQMDTFKRMKKHFEEIPRDLRRNELSRDIYYSIEFTKMIQEENKEEDLSKVNQDLEKALKGIFEDEEDFKK